MTKLSAIAILAIFTAGCSSPYSGDEGTSGEALTAADPVDVGTELRVTASALNLRNQPDASATILAVLRHGDVVIAIRSGTVDGWVNVQTADQNEGQIEGWVHGDYVDLVSADSIPSTAPSTGATCDPNRARNVVNRYQKALHDTIAFAEGTRGRSKDGYDVIFGYRVTPSCAAHPNQCVPYARTCTTASGRYQFLTNTWRTCASALGLPSFEPENQEKAAAHLVSAVRRVTVPSSRPLSASEFANAMSKLSYEWASLPPSRYRQPTRSLRELRAEYCAAVGC